MKYAAAAFGLCALALTTIGAAADQSERVAYGTTPRIACAPLFVCTITLIPHDVVGAIAAGDTARWLVTQVRANDTPVILVKPKEPGIRTNLIVATNTHVYYVTLESRSDAGAGRVSFYIPAPRRRAVETHSAAAAPSASRSPSPSPSPSPTPYTDNAYHMSGDRSFAPQTVYNDGERTYLVYEKIPSELPVVLAVSSGGDQLVNFRFSDGAFILDGTPAQIDLVLHAGTGRRGRGERRLHIYHDHE